MYHKVLHNRELYTFKMLTLAQASMWVCEAHTAAMDFRAKQLDVRVKTSRDYEGSLNNCRKCACRVSHRVTYLVIRRIRDCSTLYTHWDVRNCELGLWVTDWKTAAVCWSAPTINNVALLLILNNKKLNCRRENARCSCYLGFSRPPDASCRP